MRNQSPESRVGAFLEREGEGLEHIALENDDIEADVARALGVPLFEDRIIDANDGYEAFVPPKAAIRHLLLFAALVASPAHGQDSRDAAPPIPAACQGLKLPPPTRPAEHRPYPPIGMRWPVDVAKAEIAKDERVAHRLSEYFRPLSLEEVRANLSQYLVVPRERWEHDNSHVALSDEGGWVATERECFQWIVRPGGLAWIVYADGTAVYLAGAGTKDE